MGVEEVVDEVVGEVMVDVAEEEGVDDVMEFTEDDIIIMDDEMYDTPSKPPKKAKSTKSKAKKRLSEEDLDDVEIITVEEEVPEALVLDADTPTRQLQMASKVFLKKINIKRLNEEVANAKRRKLSKQEDKGESKRRLEDVVVVDEEEVTIDEEETVEITPITNGGEEWSPRDSPMSQLFGMRKKLGAKVSFLPASSKKRVRFL